MKTMQLNWRGLTLFSLTTLLMLSGCGYNTMQRQDEEVKGAWSEVLNQYKRRSDLVPNLVKTVKGYASHERETLESVTQARAKVSALQISDTLLQDPDAFARFQQAQQGLGGALSRLIAVAENYPQLKADGIFRDLQAQLEGTENRIAVARGRYIQTVKEYNTTVRSFPSNLTAKWFNLPVRPTFTVENEAALAEAPAVDFAE